MFGKLNAKNNYLLGNINIFIFSCYCDKVFMHEFDLYSCCKERSVTILQNDNNMQPFQYSMFRRQKKKNDRQKIHSVSALR